MKNTISNTNRLFIGPEDARRLALAEVGAQTACFTGETLVTEPGRVLYGLDFIADDLYYSCYVDAADGAVVGLSFEPTAA